MAAPAELIRKIRRIEITTRRAVQDTLAGSYHSVFKGRGMAFSEVRPYQPGDEIRSDRLERDRSDGRAVREGVAEERELTALIAVDRSASQDAGLARQSKAEVRRRSPPCSSSPRWRTATGQGSCSSPTGSSGTSRRDGGGSMA